jgi:hypothetical protein
MTAKEQIGKYYHDVYILDAQYNGKDKDILEKHMIEFAKLHIEAFKEEITKKGIYLCKHDGWDWIVELDKINNLYSTENIK